MRIKAILLAILSLVFVYANEFQTNSLPIVKTIGEYTEDINFSKYSSALIQIKNTGSDSNDLDFEVIGYAHPAATDGYLIVSETLSTNDLANISITNPYYLLRIYVTETITDSVSTVEINYNLKE